MKISIIGTGYVGLVTGAVLADYGHDIVCVDTVEDKVARLNGGECPIFEPGLPELLENNKTRMTFKLKGEYSFDASDVVIIAVGTPEKSDGSANLDAVYDVIDEIINKAKTDTFIIIKSTVPIGTNNSIQRYIDKNKHDVKIEVISNPEFLSQGTAVKDMLQPERIIVGAESDGAKALMEGLYEPFGVPIILTDRSSAEMIKYASNDFLALKISYINEIANLCELFDANVDDVSRGMGMDPRIGEKFLNAGIGYGGSCFPKDTKALHWLSTQHGREIKTVKAAVEVNSQQRFRMIEKAYKYYDSFDGLSVAILGLAFKPGTDDLREAPSIDIIDTLLDNNANINVWDPVAMTNVQKIYGNKLNYYKNIDDAISNTHLCMILTEWEDIKGLDINVYSNMKKSIIIDGRNCYDLDFCAVENMVYDSIGRNVIDNR